MLPLVEEREETAWQGWEILLSAQRGKYLLTSGESSSEARLGVLKKLLGDLGTNYVTVLIPGLVINTNKLKNGNFCCESSPFTCDRI